MAALGNRDPALQREPPGIVLVGRIVRLAATPSALFCGKLLYCLTLVAAVEVLVTPVFVTLMNLEVGAPLLLAGVLAAGGYGLAAALSQKVGFERVFMISALDGDGVDDLAQHLARSVPAGPWHYAADEPTDLPLRLLAAELTREKLFERLHDELPYAAAVETTDWKELKDGSVRIEQTIYVERESQRKIVLGKGGAAIKQISTDSRRELMEIIERPVHLFLFVKVRAHWGDDPQRYHELGLDFPPDRD